MNKNLPSIYQSIIHKSRYARYLPELKRRESWEETVTRLITHLQKKVGEDTTVPFPEIKEAILNLEIMPSMRLMMVAGEACDRDNISAYNCSYLAINNKRAFSEALYILMNGTGVGFSCERDEISKLPSVPESFKEVDDVIVVGDSKLGWAKAFKKLLSSLWEGDIPTVDYSRVRPAGARLKTFGGRASGHEPLKRLFEFVVQTFKGSSGRKLNSLEVHDMLCMIGEIVVVGGVRRSALISLSNLTDKRMRDAKTGAWYNENPHRGLANNSVSYSEKPDSETFMEEWLSLVKSKSGERGIFNRVAAQTQAGKWGRRSTTLSYGTNPCCVTGDTLILTDKGYFPIKDLVNFPTNIWNGIEWSEVTPFSTGKQRIYEVKLSDGSNLKCTSNHKWVLAGNVRVLTEELKVGERLHKFDMPMVEGTESYPTDAYSQGFYAGDGNTGINHSWLYHSKHDLCGGRLIGSVSPYSVNYARSTWTHGPMLEKSFVPINGSIDYKLNWFAGLLDSDGTVTNDVNGNGLQIGSVDLEFLQNVKLLLTTVGVRAKLCGGAPAGLRPLPDGRGGYKEYECKQGYRLLVGNTDTHHLLQSGMVVNRLELHNNPPQRDARRFVTIESVEPVRNEVWWTDETYCFTDPLNNTGTFNGIVTGQSEIILRDKQFCNLSEVVVRAEDTLESLKRKVRLASILGTLQSTLTDFQFLSEEWKKNTEEERLLGVSLTGIMDNMFMAGDRELDGGDFDSLPYNNLEEVLEVLREVARKTNEEYANQLGVPASVAITCVKPSGTVSQLVDSASGIHTRHSSYYVRRIRMDKKDPIYHYLKDKGIPVEDEKFRPDSTAVFSFPMKAPEGAICRTDVTAIEQLELWLVYQRHYCEHKPSVTISVKDEEWPEVGAWVWKHFDEISGVSFLPHSNHTYVQAPYEDLTEEGYNDMIATMPTNIDWSDFIEEEDMTTSSQELACSAAGGCEII